MASLNYDHLSELLATAAVNFGSHTFRMLLTTSSYTPAASHTTVNNITNELSGGGYSRQTVTVTVNRSGENTSIRINHSASGRVTFASLGAGAGTPKYAIIFRRVGGADDPSDPVLFCADLGSAPTPNGTDYHIDVNPYPIIEATA